jgi:hypothetical protein
MVSTAPSPYYFKPNHVRIQARKAQVWACFSCSFFGRCCIVLLTMCKCKVWVVICICWCTSGSLRSALGVNLGSVLYADESDLVELTNMRIVDSQVAEICSINVAISSRISGILLQSGAIFCFRVILCCITRCSHSFLFEDSSLDVAFVIRISANTSIIENVNFTGVRPFSTRWDEYRSTQSNMYWTATVWNGSFVASFNTILSIRNVTLLGNALYLLHSVQFLIQ